MKIYTVIKQDGKLKILFSKFNLQLISNSKILFESDRLERCENYVSKEESPQLSFDFFDMSIK